MSNLPLRLDCQARLAIWISTALLFIPVSFHTAKAQDHPEKPSQEIDQESPPASPIETAEQPTASVAAPSTAVPVAKTSRRPAKYDVDHIGQRGIGKGMNLYSLERERALGEELARTIDRHTKFVSDPVITDYVNRVGQKLVRNSDAQVPFTIKIIDSQDIRAFSLPGGFLYVDKGLILAVDSEAELAGMMAHEIAHVVARHATRSATRRYTWDALSVPLRYFAGPIGFGLSSLGGLGVPLSLKKFNRDAESEADLLGIEYEYAAGYDPEAFIVALEKLSNREAGMRHRLARMPFYNFITRIPWHSGVARAYSSYPLTEDRIKKVQSNISTLLPYRKEYILDTSEFQEVQSRLSWSNRPILRRRAPGDRLDGPVLHRGKPDVPPPA